MKRGWVSGEAERRETGEAHVEDCARDDTLQMLASKEPASDDPEEEKDERVVESHENVKRMCRTVLRRACLLVPANRSLYNCHTRAIAYARRACG